MKVKLIILLIFISLIGKGQNDTLVYFNKLNKVIDSKLHASYYDKLTKKSKNEYNLISYALEENIWGEKDENKFIKKTDSSYIYYSTKNKKEVYKRVFNKTDSGYNIKDYFSTTLIRQGFSKSIFPLIRFGQWKEYDQFTGHIMTEDNYCNNQLISNKYWLSNGKYVSDVYTYVDKKAEYEGGDKVYLQFIADNVQYPEEARERRITGKLYVTFVLMDNGTIKGLDVLNKVNRLLEFEALRVVNLITNKWKPAEINTKKVNTLVIIPITFSLH